MIKIRNFEDRLSSRDPDIIFHNGFYYGCFSSENDTVSIIKSESIEGLSTAEPHIVYKAEKNRPYSRQLWAPELHVIKGKCYIYLAADDGDNHNHRMFVLENNSSNPLAPYTLRGKISDTADRWAIDGTIFRYNGESYFVWSGWAGNRNVCQNLYIAKMSDEFTLEGEGVMISTPEYDWEKSGANGEDESPFINEGAYQLTYNGENYLLYSASGSWCTDYCIALLKLTGNDPLDPRCWEKHPFPILSKNQMLSGAGHPSVIEKDGVYHVFFHAWDNNEKDIVWNKVSFFHGILKNENGRFVIE